MNQMDGSQIAQGSSFADTQRGAKGGAAGVTAMLSIFLLLLAFFLMLNSLARFETTKTRAVLGSLHATFNIANPTGQEHEFSSFVGKVGASEKIHKDTGDLLRTLFGFDRYELIRFGNVIVVDLDTRGLFVRGATPTPKLLVFATRLADTMLATPPGVEVMTEVTMPRGLGSLDVVDPESLSLATKRAGTVVRAFERSGFSAEHLTTGIEAGDARRVRIEFRIIDTPFEPLRAAQ